MSTPVYINSAETFLPGNPIPNDEMENILGTVSGKNSRARKIILKSNGIQNRYYAIDPFTGHLTHSNAKMTAEAIRKTVKDHQEISQIKLLCCGTSTPDQILPSHASMVHGELSNGPCELASLSGVCLSGLSAMKHGYMAVRSGLVPAAVTSGSELSSTFLLSRHFQEESESAAERLGSHPEVAFEKDFLRWMLSDGAGAVLLCDTPNRNGLSLRIDWIEQLSYAHLLPACMYAGASKNADGTLKGWREFQSYEDLGKESVFAIKQDVKLLNEFVINITVAQGLTDTLAKHRLTTDQVNWFLPHYSSNFFRDKVYASLKSINFEIEYKKWHTNLEQVGNIGSASLYFMLSDILKSGKLSVNDSILCYVPESGRFSTGFAMMTVV